MMAGGLLFVVARVGDVRLFPHFGVFEEYAVGRENRNNQSRRTITKPLSDDVRAKENG
jgi:hypothetical protein